MHPVLNRPIRQVRDWLEDCMGTVRWASADPPQGARKRAGKWGRGCYDPLCSYQRGGQQWKQPPGEECLSILFHSTAHNRPPHPAEWTVFLWCIVKKSKVVQVFTKILGTGGEEGNQAVRGDSVQRCHMNTLLFLFLAFFFLLIQNHSHCG